MCHAWTGTKVPAGAVKLGASRTVAEYASTKLSLPGNRVELYGIVPPPPSPEIVRVKCWSVHMCVYIRFGYPPIIHGQLCLAGCLM